MNSNPQLPDDVEALSEGLYGIDTGFQRPRFDAAYLLVDGGRAAFIDTGTNFAVPRLLGTLQALGLAREAVDWVIPTHVHLDHAGGAGLLMRELPRATLLVHPRGLPHLLDTRKLYQGALAVYGAEKMASDYGELVDVEARRARATHDGMEIVLGTRRLRFIDTPGHALHHHCIWDERSAGWFSGDTFGISYREFDTAQGPWLLPTTTPSQLDPQALQASVARLLEAGPRSMYLTHYGRVACTPQLAQGMLDLLQRMVQLALAQRGAALREALRTLYLDALRAHGCSLSDAECTRLLALDVDLNAQGLESWLARRER